MPRYVEEHEEQPRRPPALLRLPPHLRRIIYLHTGLARHDGCPYTYHLDGRRESRRVRSDFDPPPARHFAGLLLSCRVLYTEAAALLYSANQFVIFHRDSCQDSLAPLRALLPTSLASLTSLKIVLSESSCHQPTDSSQYPPWCCCVGRDDGLAAVSQHCVEYHHGLHRRPLLDSGPDLDSSSTQLAAQNVLAEWHDIARYVSSFVSSARLELSLVCDIDSRHDYALEAARLAVAPLALFPPLRDCHVRLGKMWNGPLQRLAEVAVLQAWPNASPLSIQPPKISAPLLSLPRELLLRILEYTDLITPWREVSWSRQDPGFQLCYPPCLDFEGIKCPPHIHRGCWLSRCNSGIIAPGPSTSSPGCFCRRRHAAFSSSCRCWAPPTALFLICQVLCKEAQFVFFSGNRFVVHDFHATRPWYLPGEQLEAETSGPVDNMRYYPYERFTASQFLRDVVPNPCLAHLRFLELAFPPYVPHGWPLDDHASVLDWQAVVGWIRGKINAPALTIRVVMVDASEGRKAMTEDQGNRILEGYDRIISPLKDLARENDLAALFVQPAYPWRWTPKTLRRIRKDGGRRLAEIEEDLKEQSENIPGRNVGSRNKAEPTRGVWQGWCDLYCP